MWGAWIEIVTVVGAYAFVGSHPVWGAWIEIDAEELDTMFANVAPRVGCVD